ncbi:GAK system XXXCH domain-containing protein [Pseudodesulfovibrio sp.]|uniref:GAK system XXXCH domain-containing protein n=1 Tax=Pseudodesulfovibrio sp. TaxID=2035812 RepID=UPI00261BFC3C|nr:GAK system XXXCH domain-containing protein [Pseudodesulfovibrio sp.]MDD3312131.1 GAK system XXXCH domain-containing protein [Pseudodesulfovibrio sp.]
MGSSIKLRKYVDRQGLAAFLRELADAVENGGSDELACLDGFQELKLGVKDEFGQLKVKAKIKPAGACEESEGEEPLADGTTRPKYKTLKKRMKTSFNVLVKTLHEGLVPPREAADAFLADAALMVTYPGYGDEYYESFSRACAAFAAACESGDVPAMHQAIDALVHEKSRCHAKYD